MVPNFISLQPDEIAIPASDTQTLTAGAATFSLGVTPPGTRAIVGVQTTDIIATSHAIHEDGQQVPKGRSPIGSGLLIGPAYGDIVPCRIPCGGGRERRRGMSGIAPGFQFSLLSSIHSYSGRFGH